MLRQMIEEKIIEFIKVKGAVAENVEISLDKPINTLLSSITYVQFLIAIEEEFEFEFDDFELDVNHFSTFNEVIDVIFERRAEN